MFLRKRKRKGKEMMYGTLYYFLQWCRKNGESKKMGVYCHKLKIQKNIQSWEQINMMNIDKHGEPINEIGVYDPTDDGEVKVKEDDRLSDVKAR